MKTFLCKMLAGCAIAARAALPNNGGYTISDVTAVSQLPWDRHVVITFTITPPPDAPAESCIRLEAVASNGVDRVYVSEASLGGDNYCNPSGRQMIRWDPTVDHKGMLFSDLTFHLAVAETNAIAPYLSVRLADGHIGYHGKGMANRVTEKRYLTDYMVFRRIPATTSDEWKAISGGKETFTFGAPADDCANPYKSGADIIREDPREIKLTHDFYMAVYPLTLGQLAGLGFESQGGESWNAGYNAAAMGITYKWLRGADTTSQYNFPATTDVAPDSLVGVLRARTGLAFDVPTEAQWEYACRAGSTNAYWFTVADEVPADANAFFSRGMGQWTVTGFTPNAWGLYAMIGCCHQWTTTLGRTSDNGNLNSADNHNFVFFDAGATDPLGPVPTYSNPYRVTRGSHHGPGDGLVPMWDGVARSIRFRVWRTAYRYPQKSDGSAGAETHLQGARLSLTLP